MPSPSTDVLNQGSSPLKSFAPITARRDTLATRANIDCRSKDELLVSVRVHSNHPDGVPTIARQQYSASEEARRKCVVKFIGSATGLNIISPTIPRYLLLSGSAFSAAVDSLNAQQRAWHDELLANAAADFDVVRGESTSTDDSELADACEWLWRHLLKAVPGRSPSAEVPLWSDRSSVTDSWADLLSRPNTCILRDRQPLSADVVAAFHSYQVLIKGANAPLTHILACQLLSYSRLRSVQPDATKEWDKLLCGQATAPVTGRHADTDTTDSSTSSDSDDGWVQSKATRKRSQQRARNARLLPTRVAQFRKQHMVGDLASRCLGETGSPLLALSSSIKVRAWETRYFSCLVDNFQSVGCDVSDLAADAVYQKLSTSIVGLTPPAAAWCVNQHNGGADVTIFVREDCRDQLPDLNTKVGALFPGMSPQLRLKCSVQQTNAHGRVLRNTPLRSIFLNEQVPVIARPPASVRSSHRATVTVTTTSSSSLPSLGPGPQPGSPPPPGSWAAAVQHGVKRLPDVSTLNHRPRKQLSATVAAVAGAVGAKSTHSPPAQKKQQQQGHQQQPTSVPKHSQPPQPQQPTAPASSLPTSPLTAATASAPDFQHSAAWQELVARNAAMEQRLNEIQAASTAALATVTRNLEIVTAQLAEQQRMFNTNLNIVVAQLSEQAALNVSLRAMLERILPTLQLQLPGLPMPPPTSPAHRGGISASVGAHDSAVLVRGNPLAGVGTPLTTSSSLNPEDSANASPAHNGQGARHG
jgi:hypothetical protein